MPIYNGVWINVKSLADTFNKEKAIVGAFSKYETWNFSDTFTSMWIRMRAGAVYLCGEQEGEGQAPHSCEVWGGICWARCEHSNNDTTITNTFQHNTTPAHNWDRVTYIHSAAHFLLWQSWSRINPPLCRNAQDILILYYLRYLLML